jgi:hypothetical protein
VTGSSAEKFQLVHPAQARYHDSRRCCILTRCPPDACPDESEGADCSPALRLSLRIPHQRSRRSARDLRVYGRLLLTSTVLLLARWQYAQGIRRSGALIPNKLPSRVVSVHLINDAQRCRHKVVSPPLMMQVRRRSLRECTYRCIRKSRSLDFRLLGNPEFGAMCDAYRTLDPYFAKNSRFLPMARYGELPACNFGKDAKTTQPAQVEVAYAQGLKVFRRD